MNIATLTFGVLLGAMLAPLLQLFSFFKILPNRPLQ